ncbi:hypothetical protein VH567_03850 [Sphingomonas sp. 4RDLI-65]|uniref:hypothetical protein n=1 Tax=Sphingomonas sp. 4RDLI-65 TaxID=3111641 RepID=UPI003C19629A
MKVFGIGCIYFGYKFDGEQIPPEIENFNVFCTDVKDRLETVESISGVTFNDIDTEYGNVAVVDEFDYQVATPIPHGARARISFDVYIPFRVQETTIRLCDVEHLHVDIVYGYELPVAIVSYDWPDEEGDATPSMAVALVRKFLDKRLSDDSFKCDCIGPSPFHANFTISESSLDEGYFLRDRSDSTRGYSDIELVCPSGSSLIGAFYAANLDDVFSSFYHLSDLRGRTIRSHTEITADATMLLSAKNDEGPLSRFRSMRTQRKTIDSINSAVFKEMLFRMDIESALSEAARSSNLAQSPLNPFFDEYRTLFAENRWGKFSEVAKFFEERNQKALSNITAVFAGVVGGVLGSVIGSLATYILTKA